MLRSSRWGLGPCSIVGGASQRRRCRPSRAEPGAALMHNCASAGGSLGWGQCHAGERERGRRGRANGGILEVERPPSDCDSWKAFVLSNYYKYLNYSAAGNVRLVVHSCLQVDAAQFSRITSINQRYVDWPTRNLYSVLPGSKRPIIHSYQMLRLKSQFILASNW
jgi:hypothetical protein